MPLRELASLLKKAAGLNAASLGRSTLERAVRQRALACALSNGEDYLAMARSSEAELQLLIEAVVVPETWFFRDHEAFRTLQRMATQEWLTGPGPAYRTGRPTPPRLLSVPCSTGEEPYSMAMTLLEAGFPPERFHIDAVDISTPALAAAKAGVYGPNSFRGSDLGFRERFFKRCDEGHRVTGRVQNSVSFEKGNLLCPRFWAPRGGYQFIFCRNVLIYFDRDTQERVVRLLHRLLAPRGVVFVGPVETALFARPEFVSAKAARAFAFHKAAALPTPRIEPQVEPPSSRPAATGAKRGEHESAHYSPRKDPSLLTSAPTVHHPNVRRTGVEAFPGSPPLKPARSSRTRLISKLELANRLADKGQLPEAAELCRSHLKDHPDSAPALYLLGVVLDASGETKAACEHYRKAIYLDPNHTEAMAHLSLLIERMGDTDAALILQNRARRQKLNAKN
jgi:chemotaxis protein methyltransferase WspC